MNGDFVRKAIMNNMTEQHVEAYKKGTNSALYAGAIQYADGIVLGSEHIDADVLNNVKNSNKSVLEFDSTADFENYYNFYDEITNDELVDVA
jgi:starch synthase